MHLQNFIFIVLLILMLFGVFCRESDRKERNKEFIPTNEWQVLKKGQKIPKGLHVRVHLETGTTEAKLLKEDVTDQKHKKNALLNIPRGSEDGKLLQSDVIKKALRKLKSKNLPKTAVQSKTDNRPQKFRSYEELKKEMDELNLNHKLDTEILNDLFKQYKDEIEKDTIDTYAVLRILEDFDFLAHQFDNALAFGKGGGFKQIIYKNLNLTDTKIKQKTLKLFGSLVQNNPKVQIHALETGAIVTLLRMLTLETSVDVKSRAVFALSCLLRRFPLAQLRFMENGGIPVAMKLLERDPLKVQIKLVTLFNDLLEESNQAMKQEQLEYRELLIGQYKLVNLEKFLLDQEWCQYLNKLLISLVATDPNDHDSIERCAIAMHNIGPQCYLYYNKKVLLTLQEEYRLLAKIDNKSGDVDNSDIFKYLFGIFSDILSFKNVKTEL